MLGHYSEGKPEIVLKESPESLELLADPEQLRIVLENLLNNVVARSRGELMLGVRRALCAALLRKPNEKIRRHTSYCGNFAGYF